jgi:hypothetical protein
MASVASWKSPIAAVKASPGVAAPEQLGTRKVAAFAFAGFHGLTVTVPQARGATPANGPLRPFQVLCAASTAQVVFQSHAAMANPTEENAPRCDASPARVSTPTAEWAMVMP